MKNSTETTQQARTRIKKEFDELGVDGVHKKIISDAQKRAASLYGGGAVLLQQGRVQSTEELEEKRKKFNDFVEQENEQT